jgi:hypothetical protein
MQALAECFKAIQGMTGKARNSQDAQDLQRIVDATQARVQTYPHQFEETITPDHFCNMQQVPRVNAPASMPIPHTNDNRQITQSMQPQAPILRVPTDIPIFKPISAPRDATITKPSHKPTTSVAESSKCKHQHKQQASRLRKAVPPTSPTTHIRTRAQVATAAVQVAPAYSNTCSCMRHSVMPPLMCRPGYTAAVMKQQCQQCRRVRLICRITRLENEVHLAMAVMDKDTGKLLNYRQLMNNPKYKKAWSLSAANKFRQLANGIGGGIKTPPTLLSSSPNTRYRQTAQKTSQTGNLYARSDQKRHNPTKCASW